MELIRSIDEQLWNSDMTYALGLYRKLGEVLGIWPLKSRELSSYFRVAFIIVNQLWTSFSLASQLLIKGNCDTVTDMVDVLSSITCTILTIIKVLLPKIHTEDMKIIIYSAIDDWNTHVNEKSRKIMLRFAKIGRVVFITQMTAAYVVILPSIFAQLSYISMSRNERWNTNFTVRSVPLEPDCWVSLDWSTYHYAAYYILQLVQVLVICTAYIGGDTYFFGIAMHVCGQFEVLYTSMECPAEMMNETDQERRIAAFSSRHNHLLMLAENSEKTYNIIILAQVGADTILTCITGIVLLINIRSPDSTIIIVLLLRIYLVYIQLFMYSYVGEQLSSQSEKLRMAIYNSPWYEMPPDSVRNMSFIIRRCAYPFNLTAGKIYPMNITNFKNILKTMTSYFSILRLMLINEQE